MNAVAVTASAAGTTRTTGINGLLPSPAASRLWATDDDLASDGMVALAEASRAAFNAGSDARVAGRPISACPVEIEDSKSLRRAFREGWKDANDNWGWWVRGRYAFRMLPKVLHGSDR